MIKLDKIWDTIKTVSTIASIVTIVFVLVFVVIILTNKISINIEENCTATTTEDVPMQMPISFTMNNKMTFKGNADVVIVKDTELPMRIKMKVTLDIIKIMSGKPPISISFK